MFYFSFQDKQIPTGVTDPLDHDGARAAMERIIREMVADSIRLHQPVPPPPPVFADARTVATARDEYVAACERKIQAGKLAAKTLYDYRLALDAFVEAMGDKPISSL